MENDKQLIEKYINSIGIDFSAYRTEDLQRGIGLLLHFPAYATLAFAVPFFTILGIFGLIAGIFFWWGLTVLGIIFAAFGLLSAMGSGSIIGVHYLSRRIATDLYRLFYALLELTQQILTDRQKISLALPPNASFRDFLQGTQQLVFIPMVRQSLRQRIPLIGSSLAWIVEKAFNQIAKRLSTQVVESQVQLPPNAPEDTRLQRLIALSRNMQAQLDDIVGFVRRLFITPLRWVVWLVILGNIWVLITAIILMF